MGGDREREREREGKINIRTHIGRDSPSNGTERERETPESILFFSFFLFFFPGMQSVWAASSLGRPTDEECISAVVNKC